MTLLILSLALAIAPAERVVSGTGLRLRERPDASAPLVGKATIGTVLGCVEETAPATIGGKTATWCKAPKGGYYFTAHTEPREADLEVQRLAIAERALAALGDDVGDDRRADLYEIHMLAASLRSLPARLFEAELVGKHVAFFEKDKRVVQDDSQGPRMKNEVFEALLQEAKGTPSHERAAWALAAHGWPGECEGFLACVLARVNDTACRYLLAFPSGAHAPRAVELVSLVLEAGGDATEEAAEVDERLKATERCVAAAKAGDVKRATVALEALRKSLKTRAPAKP